MTKNARKAAFVNFNLNFQGLMTAIQEKDLDNQIVFLSKAMEDLEKAKEETIKMHGGITN